MKKPTITKKTLKRNKLAHYQHAAFLDKIEEMSMAAFDHVTGAMIRAIISRLKEPQNSVLQKADKLKRGWTGDVPKADLDVEKILDELMGQYTQALRWILLGDAAGRDAKIAAKLMKLEDFVVPGIIPAVYMNSLDTQRQHYEDIFGAEPEPMNKEVINESLQQIVDRSKRFMDESELKLRNRVIEAIEMTIKTAHDEALASIHQTAHDLMGEGKKPKVALNEAIKTDAPDRIPISGISRALREAIERYRQDWQLMTQIDTGLASSVAAHQSMVETFGRTDPNVRVVIIDFRDERECSFCREMAHRPDGSFKIYSISDFAPSGTNLSRKRKDWILTWPPTHPRCRCEAIYLPPGFVIDNNGNLRPATTP